ncbi:membrane protein insertase YidC [Ornithinimicrobium avium]|uniref:Membrane protein insertase YidC n=2 Tax=Ornithinimicrobium avium TaxID=2283195 RepID=A0A345NMA0_9MICO|nr:membrane protein insertase YidC [Ornithinimicrobium avium]
MIVLITLAVRAALHPTNRRNQRLAVRRRDLQPQIAELRKKHKDDAQALQREVMALHKEEQVPMAPGCLSMLIQLPVFGMVYRLFTAPELAGHHNQLLDHAFLGVPLSERMGAATPGQRWVFFALIGLTVAVAAFAAWQMRRHMAEDRAAQHAAQSATKLSAQQQQMADTMERATKVMPLMSFMTVMAVASVPLAAGLYLVTSSTWGLLERASLRRVRHAAAPAAGRSQPA